MPWCKSFVSLPACTCYLGLPPYATASKNLFPVRVEIICLRKPVMSHFHPCKGNGHILFYIVTSIHTSPFELDHKQLKGKTCAFFAVQQILNEVRSPHFLKRVNSTCHSNFMSPDPDSKRLRFYQVLWLTRWTLRLSLENSGAGEVLEGWKWVTSGVMLRSRQKVDEVGQDSIMAGVVGGRVKEIEKGKLWPSRFNRGSTRKIRLT